MRFTVPGPDGTPDYLNARNTEYTGLTPEQLRDRGWRSTVHPEDVPRVLELWTRSTATGELFEAEYRLRRADIIQLQETAGTRPEADANVRKQTELDRVNWAGDGTVAVVDVAGAVDLGDAARRVGRHVDAAGAGDLEHARIVDAVISLSQGSSLVIRGVQRHDAVAVGRDRTQIGHERV